MPKYIVTGRVEGHVSDEVDAANETEAVDRFWDRADRAEYTGGFYPEEIEIVEVELVDEAEEDEFEDDEEVNG